MGRLFLALFPIGKIIKIEKAKATPSSWLIRRKLTIDVMNVVRGSPLHIHDGGWRICRQLSTS